MVHPRHLDPPFSSQQLKARPTRPASGRDARCDTHHRQVADELDARRSGAIRPGCARERRQRAAHFQGHIGSPRREGVKAGGVRVAQAALVLSQRGGQPARDRRRPRPRPRRGEPRRTPRSRSEDSSGDPVRSAALPSLPHRRLRPHGMMCTRATPAACPPGYLPSDYPGRSSSPSPHSPQARPHPLERWASRPYKAGRPTRRRAPPARPKYGLQCASTSDRSGVPPSRDPPCSPAPSTLGACTLGRGRRSTRRSRASWCAPGR